MVRTDQKIKRLTGMSSDQLTIDEETSFICRRHCERRTIEKRTILTIYVSKTRGRKIGQLKEISVTPASSKTPNPTFTRLKVGLWRGSNHAKRRSGDCVHYVPISLDEAEGRCASPLAYKVFPEKGSHTHPRNLDCYRIKCAVVS